MEIGKRIKVLREKKDFTQEELAERIQISRSALANYESGLREPKGDILKRFAKALDTTTDYLLGRTDDPYPPSQNQSNQRNGDPRKFTSTSEKYNSQSCPSQRVGR